MIDFIRADFYRLMRSKGFWITEFALFCVISLGTLFQSNIRFGANISNHETATQALGKVNWSSSPELLCGQYRQSVLFHHHYHQYDPWSGSITKALQKLPQLWHL